jgi:acyl-CoA dehydrogenase
MDFSYSHKVQELQTRVHVAVCDRAMQVFGAMGLSPDTPLATMWTNGRILRIADGPDEVHFRSIARTEVKQASDTRGATAAYMTMPEILRSR